MPKYRAEWWLKCTHEFHAKDTDTAAATLDEALSKITAGDTLKIGVTQIDPPLPAPPPGKPTKPFRPRGGKPNGGGSPGTPVLGRYTITKAEAKVA